MRCEDVYAHLADYLAETLRPELAGEVATHLQTCGACAAEVDALDQTWEMLGALAPDRANAHAMRSRFAAFLDGYQARGAEVESAHAAKSVVRIVGLTSARYALALAAAAALLVIGVAIGRETRRGAGVDPQIAQLGDEVRSLREMVALSLLQQPSPTERLKGVTWTGQIERPGNEVAAVLLETLMHDPNVNVRLATVDALKRFADREPVRQGTLEALPRQSSPLVQIALIDFVVEVNGGKAAEALRRLSGDPNVNDVVRARAAAILRKII
jgi:hypothetical protein